MKIASIFTDGAVLQADMPIKIFGTGSGIAKVSFLGEEVEGFFEGEEWCLTLSSHQYGGPYELTVVLNGEEKNFKNIYIGEVWIAAGQSNMEMPLFRTEGGFDEALHCHNDKIRFFTVPRRTQSDKHIYGWHFIKSDGQDTPWQICDKQSALSFSAIGYYSAKELNQKLDVCIGVISCNWGGRAIESFIAKEYFESVPSLQSFMENYNQETIAIDYDEYLRAHSEALEKRKQTYDSIDYDEIEDVRIKGIRATTSGPYIHPLPKGPYNESSPSVLYESMFRRIMPFSARGMLWYQGESNGYCGYAEKYGAFMDSMRKGFKNQDMKFYAVELASFGSIWSCDRQTTDDSNWDNAQKAPNPHGEIRLCEVEPIVQRGELKPISIIKCDDGYIYDFGVNEAGVCKLSIKGEKGQKIFLQHFEKTVDGKPFLNNIKFTPEQRFQEDEYICSGNGEEVHIPRFTYHGFRYVYVTGITEKQANEELLTFLLLSSDVKVIGSFESSDEVVNKIQEATVRSDISNFYYFPSDCPQREKNGWTADASLSAEQMLWNLAPDKSIKEWLKNIYKSIDDIGRVPGIIPTTGWGYERLNGPAWDGVIVNLPYYIYMYRGDKSIFEDLKIPLMRYLTYLYTLLNEDDLVEYGLGDWCQANTSRESAFDTPAVVTNSILTVDIADKAAFIYEVLEMKEQQEYALKLAQRVRTSIRNKLYDTEQFTAICKTQTAQAMAVYYNIFEPNEKLNAVENLVELINKNDGFMKVGVLGGRVIFRVLADYGYADLAYDMITRPEFPSYGNWIKRGATTLWELFTLDDTAKGSLNHHFWGDVSAWFYTYLAGIKINPNFNNVNEINIEPCFVEKLDHVKASHKLPSGEITVEWKRMEKGICLEIDIPQSVKGNIILNGKYTFENGASIKKISKGNHLIFYK